MAEDEQPPESYYGDDDALMSWFESVKQKRNDRYKSKETLEEVPQVQNEAARELLK